MTKHLEKIIGLSCIKSFCGYAGHLKISFSKEKNIVDLFINGQLNAEWEFETISGAWRLTQNDHLLTGSYEDYEHNDHELKKNNQFRIIRYHSQKQSRLHSTF